MKPLFSFRKRVFLNPVSTGYTSHILAEVESSLDGTNKWGNYMVTLADCRRQVRIDFFLGTKHARRNSLRKIDLLIEVLTKFREALIRERDLIDKGESRGPKKRVKKT